MPIGLLAHGGYCCGVTHLYMGSLTSPDVEVPAINAFDPLNPHLTGAGVGGYVFTGNAILPKPQTVYVPTPMGNYSFPAQMIGMTLTEMLAIYIKNHRSGGIIEAIATGNQVKEWNDWFINRGFQCVGESINSNTRRKLHAYMLFYNGSFPKEIQKLYDDAYSRVEARKPQKLVGNAA